MKQPAPPQWTRALVAGGQTQQPVMHGAGLSIRVTAIDGIALLEATVPRVRELADDVFQQRVVNAYDELFKAMATRPPLHPLRLWNFIPNIHQRCSDGRDRYMVFNGARHTAYQRGLTPGTPFPASSAVGHHGDDLHIHILAAAQPGHTLENPRQVPACRYSPKYGPVPPLFSRGCVARLNWAQRPTALLLTAGTASILGEDSLHTGDLAGQLGELCINMDKLCRAALTLARNGNGSAPQNGEASSDPLALFHEARAYVTHPRDVDGVIEAMGRKCPGIRTLEIMHADICRSELLVEVEGVAVLAPLPHTTESGDANTVRRSPSKPKLR